MQLTNKKKKEKYNKGYTAAFNIGSTICKKEQKIHFRPQKK